MVASMKALVWCLPLLLPAATRWAEGQEAVILAQGVPLTESERADARAMGVLHPERVRALQVDHVPMPVHPLLRRVAQAAGLLFPQTAGMALGYGIFIRQDYWGHRTIVAHECVHVGQYERLGGFRPFLRQYVAECLTFGYPLAPLEMEAVQRSTAMRG